MDIGIVPGEIGILPEYRGVTGTPLGVNGPIWVLVERERGGQGRPHAPSPLGLNWTREGEAAPPFLLPLPLLPFASLPLGGILLGLVVLVGLLLGARPTGAGRPPPLLLHIWGKGGTLEDTS